MRRIVALAALLLAIVALAAGGCSSASDTSSDDATSAGESATTPAQITLPDGWTMTDAISAEEVGAITGETMEVFPEASSAAQSGRPAGGFVIAGTADSKIYFGVDVQGGESGFELQKSYATSDSVEEVSGLGDKAFVCTFSDGRAGIVVLSGEAVVRVDWNPAVYTEDPSTFSGQLAGKLLENMYK